VTRGGRVGVRDEELPAHAEVAEHGISAASTVHRVLELHPEVLAAAGGADDRAALEAVDEVGRAGQVAAQRADVVHRDGADRVTDHVVGDAESDDLDLGELRHGRARRSRGRC
jgi:hypothetical protein